MDTTRRHLLVIGCLAPLAFGTAMAADTSCGDALSMSQKNRRRSLGYVDISDDPKRRCGLCAYFTAGDNNCGACQMLSGSMVSMNGVCNSFVSRDD